MSTTINSYSVALGLNAEGLIDGSKLARNEARQLQRTLDQMVNPIEKVNAKFDLLEKAVREGAIHETTAAEIKRRLTGTLQGNTDAVNANAEAIRRDNALLAEGERLTRQLMTTEERHAAEIRRINTLRNSKAIGETTYQRAIANANQRFADSRIVTASVVKTPPTVKNAIMPQAQGQGMMAAGASALSSRLTNLAAGYIGVYSAANFAAGAITKAADIEKAAASYEVLTGSAEQARKMISEVRDIANQGISLTSLNQSAKIMLSSGIAAQTVLPTLRQIAEITGGDTERMGRMALAFSQVAGNGRLMAEELNQLVEAGFNPLQEISRTTGISIADLRKQMADGLISFDMVKGAFESVTSEGGRYNGMLDKISETTAGAINSAKATFEAFQISVGDALSPAIRALSQDFKDSAGAGGELVGIVRELSQGIADLSGGMRGMTGRGIIGTGSSGLGFSQAVGSQVRETLTTAVSIWGDLFQGDMKTVIEKTQDVLTPFEKINEYLDQQNAATMRAAQAAAGGKPQTMSESNVAGMITEPPAEKVAQTYNRLQDSIKKAQASAIPTLDNLQQQVTDQARDALASSTHSKFSKLSRAEKEAEIHSAEFTGGLSERVSRDMEARLKAASDQDLARWAVEIASRDKDLEGRDQNGAFLADAKLRMQSLVREPAKEEIDRQDRLRREAERIQEQAITPIERLADQFSQLAQMQELGFLDPAAVARERERLLGENTKDIRIEAPKNLEVGSQDAYKFFAENANREQQRAVQAEARANTEKQVAAIKEVRTAVDNLAGNIKRKR